MENIILNKTEDSSFITISKDFIPRLTYFVVKTWDSYWGGYHEVGVKTLTLMDKDCGVTLKDLKKAISRRGLGAKIVKESHSHNGDEQSFYWSLKEWFPVYKIGNEYYVYAFDKAQFGGVGITFQHVNHRVAEELDILEQFY